MPGANQSRRLAAFVEQLYSQGQAFHIGEIRECGAAGINDKFLIGPETECRSFGPGVDV